RPTCCSRSPIRGSGMTERGAIAADALETTELPPQSPGQLFWRQLRKSPLAIAGGALLALFYAGALFAPFLAPYAPEAMDRERFFHPPQRLHWIDASHHWHALPFVYA